MLKRKISAYFEKRKYAFLVVFTAICAGVVVGAFGVVNSEAESVAAFNQMSSKEIIVSSFLENLKFSGWLVLWGMNLFGWPVIIYLLYTKGVTISAALCTLSVADSSSGVMLILSVLPYLACTIVSIMILAQGSLCCSFGLFKSLWNKRSGKMNGEGVLMLIGEFIPAAMLSLLGGVCETISKVNIV